MESNLWAMGDAYKYTHGKMYPENVEYMYGYAFARKRNVLFFGLRYLIENYFKPSAGYDPRMASYIGQGFEAQWAELMEVTDGGKWLPLRIVAVQEGSAVFAEEALFTVENTDPRFPWLVTFVETLLLKVWYPTTIATRSRLLFYDLERLWYDVSEQRPTYTVHDFGYRGATSEESAALASAAHLMSFLGTDTTSGLYLLEKYYDIPFEKTASTIPASEHSVMMMGNDHDMISHILDVTPDDQMVSIVLDTYDYTTCVLETICGTLAERLKSRAAPVVIRPDSGVPEHLIPWTLNVLASHFGTTDNIYGYKVLNNIRVIWGDGLTPERIVNLTKMIIDGGFSPENVTFGMGGGLHNGVDRDTYGFSFKVSEYTTSDGVAHPVSKLAPNKQTRAGRQNVRDGQVVYEDGKMSFDQLQRFISA